MECALRYFCLIGRVACEELRTFDEVLYHSWSIVVVASGTGKTGQLRCEHRVGDTLEEGAYLLFAHLRLKVVVLLELQVLWYVGIQGVDIFNAHRVKHLPDVLLGVGEVFMSFPCSLCEGGACCQFVHFL